MQGQLVRPTQLRRSLNFAWLRHSFASCWSSDKRPLPIAAERTWTFEQEENQAMLEPKRICLHSTWSFVKNVTQRYVDFSKASEISSAALFARRNAILHVSNKHDVQASIRPFRTPALQMPRGAIWMQAVSGVIATARVCLPRAEWRRIVNNKIDSIDNRLTLSTIIRLTDQTMAHFTPDFLHGTTIASDRNKTY